MHKARKKKRPPKCVLALPDLEQSKAAVLNSQSEVSPGYVTAERAGAASAPKVLPASLECRKVGAMMSRLRARVENGRLVLDEPTTLPEGTIVDLVADDEGDDLTNEERHALHEALSASWKSAEAGSLRPAEEILEELRRRQ